MAINFKFGRNKTINITIKDHAIRFVELKQAQPLVVHRMGERFLPTGLIKEGKIVDFDTLSTILEQCVADWKIAKKDVRFLVPDPFVVIRKLSIPQDVNEDEIKGYLYLELGTSIHLPFEEPVFDFVTLHNPEKEVKEILLFAAPEEIVKEYMELFEEVKLKPIAADISSLALYRYMNQLEQVDISGNTMMIQMDLQTVNVSIFENTIPVFMRHLIMEIEMDKWSHSIQQESLFSLHFSGNKQEVLSPLEDIYKEIDRVMNFYRYSLHHGKQQVQKIILDGDHPWLDEIYDQMQSRFDIPFIKINSTLLEQPYVEPIPAQFHLNAGLGLKEV